MEPAGPGGPATRAGRPDGLLCYDRERGDTQLLEPDLDGRLHTRWIADRVAA